MSGRERAPHVETAERRPMFALTWWMLPAVILPAYLLRLFNLGRVVNYLDDRYINAPGALNYVRFGMPGPDNWFTQPAKHLSMWASIELFGNDAFGWGMRQVLVGTGVVLLTFLLARRTFRAPFPALFAAALVALDPAWVVFSRAGSEDPAAVLLILAALFFWTRAVQEGRDPDMAVAGVLIGLATATRWYAGLVAVVMLAIALVAARRRGPSALMRLVALLGALPVAAYLVPFLPWMARGNSLGDLWSYQLDSFLVQRTASYPAFDPALAPLVGPEGWFTRWMAVSATQFSNGGRGAFTVMMNDPFVWALFVPAAAFLGWQAWRRRLPEAWLLVGVFAVLYAFFLAVERPIYLYSALCLVPVGAIAVGNAVGRLLGRRSLLLLAAVMLWSAYLYPLTSSIPVPVAAYRWPLTALGVTGVFQ